MHGLTRPSGIWCTDDMILQQEALKFFKTLFCNQNRQCTQTINLPHIILPQLNDRAKSALSSSVTYEEISTALNHMSAYKSLGPDGFQGIFFEQYWHIIGDDIFKLISKAFKTSKFDPAIAETLICLIPEVDCPTSFKEFRPISLCNTV